MRYPATVCTRPPLRYAYQARSCFHFPRIFHRHLSVQYGDDEVSTRRDVVEPKRVVLMSTPIVSTEQRLSPIIAARPLVQ